LGPVLAPRGGPEILFPLYFFGGQKWAWPKRSVVDKDRGQKWASPKMCRVGQSRIFLVYKQRTTLIQQSVVYQTRDVKQLLRFPCIQWETEQETRSVSHCIQGKRKSCLTSLNQTL
jgi:hypothetical protein